MWQLLAAAVPSVIKGITHSANKPKKDDYKAQTEGLRKYVGYLKGRRGTNQVMEQAMRPALRAVGEAGKRAQSQIGHGAQRAGLGGSGIEAAQRQQARQQQTQQLQTIGEQATAAQMAADRETEGKVQEQYGQLDDRIKRSEDAYKAAEREHKQQMNQIWAQGISNVATAGLSMGQQAQTAKAASLAEQQAAEVQSGRAKAFAGEFGEPTKGTGGGLTGKPWEPPVDAYSTMKKQGYTDQDIIDRYQKQQTGGGVSQLSPAAQKLFGLLNW